VIARTLGAGCAWASLLGLLLAGCGEDGERCEADVPCLVAEALPYALLSVRATTADDVWVAGTSPDPATEADTSGPAALHWDGSEWVALNTEAWPGVELWWVHATADEAVFVGSEGTILEFDLASGDGVAVEGPAADVTFFGVWGASADDLWAVGQTDGGGGPPALWRRTAGAWAAFEDPTLGPGLDGVVYFKVHGATADDVWIVGNHGTALHWDGGALTAMATDEDLETETTPLLTVDVGGAAPLAVGGFGSAVLLEWDGAGWRDRSPDFQPGLNGVCTGPDGAGLVVGQAGSRSTLVDGTWTPDLDLEIDPMTFLDWHACAIDDDGGVWTVGGQITSRPLNNGVVAYTGAGRPGLLTP